MKVTVLVLSLLASTLALLVQTALGQSNITLTVVVIDSFGGADLPGVSVQLYSVDAALEQRTNANGIVRFENLRQGSYELEVFFPNLKPVIEKIEISDKTQEPVVIKLQTVTVGRLGLPCMGTEGEPPSVSISYVERSSRVDLTGLIRNELRMPVSNVSLNLVGHDMSRDAVSNNSGEFAFSGLAPGKYVLSSTRGAYRDIDGSVWITHNNLAKVIIDERQLSCIDHVLNSERTQDKTGPLLQLPRPE